MRETRYPSVPAFVVNVHNMDLSYGGHIDWDKVPNAAPYARPDGKKTLPAGTVLIRQADGTRIPRELGAVGEVASEITWNAIQQDSREDSHRAYAFIVGGVLWGNLLAKHHRDNAAFATWLQELKDNGTGFRFETYRDTRVS